MDFLGILPFIGILGTPVSSSIEVNTAIKSLSQLCLEMRCGEEKKFSQEFEKAIVPAIRTMFEQSIVESRIMLSTLDTIKKEVLAQLCLGDVTSLHTLPVLGDLTKDDISRIFYLSLKDDFRISLRGQKDYCSYWIASFARALNELFERHKPLTVYNIKMLAQVSFNELIGMNKFDNGNVNLPTLFNLVRGTELGNIVHVLSDCHLNFHPLNCQSIIFRDGNYELSQEAFAEVQAVLRDNERSGLFHFIGIYPYEYENSAFLLSIIKRPFRKPFMIILDAQDRRIPLNGNDKYVVSLYKLFIQPAYQKIIS